MSEIEKTNDMDKSKLKIVVLDGYTENPGDLSWNALEALAGECVVFDRTEPDQVLARSAGAQVLLTNKVAINRDIIESLPDLQYIGVLATGYNIVDVEAAREHGVVVTNVPSYSTYSVVQMVMAHLLNITNRVQAYTDDARAGKWSRCEDFNYTIAPLHELAGKKMAIVGLGHIGMAVARVAVAMGMKVLAVTSKKQSALPEGVTKVTMERAFAECDVLSLHCPLTPQTHHLVNQGRLATMKPSAIVINTSRGPVVNEHDLADALNHGVIAAAGVDVLSQEPPLVTNPLLTAANCYVTPHIAWASVEARQRLMRIIVDNVAAFIDGNPVNVVN